MDVFYSGESRLTETNEWSIHTKINKSSNPNISFTGPFLSKKIKNFEKCPLLLLSSTIFIVYGFIGGLKCI